MKGNLLMIVLFGVVSSFSMAEECTYTGEQQYVLDLAYMVGKEYDLGYTLAAIVKQESFVGENVIRINNNDGKYGSYGVTHINLETGMYFTGITNSWKARANLAPRLIFDDEYALELGLTKLLSKKNLGWNNMVRSYNGSLRVSATTDYMMKIKKHVATFQKCKQFEREVDNE